MKTPDELRQFYETSLIPVLQELDGERKKIADSVIVFLAIAGAAIAMLAVIAFNPTMLIALVSTGSAIFGILFYKSLRDFNRDFKFKVIKEIVEFIDPRLEYESGGFISETAYLGSEIFKINPDRYSGSDYVSGKLGVTQMEFSLIHAEYKTEETDKDGRRHTHWHTIFKGIFFAADFNKEYHGRTVVLPDTAERLFGFLGTALQSMNVARGQLIKMEDPEFEKLFVVYGDDQVESRYVLSTSLMDRIVDFKKKSNSRIYLSFVGSKIFVAIEHVKELFAPRLWKTLVDFSLVQEYFEHLELVLGIVDDLNLNTRIWSKQ